MSPAKEQLAVVASYLARRCPYRNDLHPNYLSVSSLVKTLLEDWKNMSPSEREEFNISEEGADQLSKENLTQSKH
jgi:hypothetical protein